jgi:hypothetical protein
MIDSVGPQLQRCSALDLGSFAGFSDELLLSIAERCSALRSFRFGGNVPLVSPQGIVAFVKRTDAPIEDFGIVNYRPGHPHEAFVPDLVVNAILERFGPQLRKLELARCRAPDEVRGLVSALQLPLLGDLQIFSFFVASE